MIKILQRSLPYVVMAVLLVSGFPRTALASTACSATVSPSSVPPGSENVLQFDIQNTGTQAITSISVQQPDVNYDINGISQSGWVDNTNSSGTTLSGSSLAPGSTYSFSLAMFTGPSEEPSANWIISTSSGGASSNCGGQIATSIANAQAPPTANGESNIGLTKITPTSATINWTSSAPSTSYVYYGRDTGYGKTATSPGSASDHSVTLNGLSPNTVYHYKVAGSDDSGNNFFSDDNTFVTPEAPVQNQLSGGGNNSGSGSQPSTTVGGSVLGKPLSSLVIHVPPVTHDTTPPTVSLAPIAKQPYVTPPLFKMTAHDNGAIARMDYSTDGGANWLPANQTDGIGGQSATASFTPTIIEDGNYQIIVRAVDSNGNIATDGPQTLVIDQLPPRFGNLTITFGAQVLDADTNGSLSLSSGSVYKLTGQAVGGATSIEMRATSSLGRVKTFSLSENRASGLWSGALSFEQAGIYQLAVYGLDGAGNKTDRQIGQVSVVPTGKVIDNNGKSIKNAKVSLYYLEPSTQHWTLWDGKPYGQTNPQTVTKTGYSLMAPAGQYYLQASGDGYGTIVSRKFTVKSAQSLGTIFTLPNRTAFHIGNHALAVPSWSITNQTPIRPLVLTAKKDALLGSKLSNFSLPRINGGSLQPLDLNGRPSVITLLNTWSPSGVDQLPALQRASKNQNINIVPLFEGERPEVVKSYLDLANISLNGVADPTNSQTTQFTAGFGPKHIFIDHSGHIKKVMVGVLSEEELLQELGGL